MTLGSSEEVSHDHARAEGGQQHEQEVVWTRPISTSMEKMAAAIGALNVAAIPPAAPHVTSVRTLGRGQPCPLADRRADGRADLHHGALAAGRPAEPDGQRRGDHLDGDDPLADMPAAGGQRGHHLGNAMTLRLRANHWTSGPTMSPPSAGRSTSWAGPNRSSRAATGPRATSAIRSITKMNPTDPRPVATPTTTARMMR